MSMMLLVMTVMTSCKTINVYIVDSNHADVLVDQRGSDVTSDLDARLK